TTTKTLLKTKPKNFKPKFNRITYEKAIKATLNKLTSPQHSSVYATALKFEVAETTLSYKETQLVGYCLNMQSLEFGLTRSGVNHCVIEINIDETGFIISARVQKVLAKKGAYQVHKIAYGNVHEHISIASTISGLLTGAPSGSIMAFIDSGYMKESIFEMYIKHFVNSISPSHLLAEILFSKLKKEYDKGCNRLHNINGKIVTKYSFTSILGLAYIKAFTSEVIMNLFKTTRIWPFNPDTISIDHLNLSLSTKKTDFLLSLTKQTLLSPSLPTSSLSSSSLPSTLLSSFLLLSSLLLSSSLFSSSHISLESLKIENEHLKKEIKQLEKMKQNYITMQEELETFKKPGTSSLKLILKYPASCLLSANETLKEADNLAKKKVEKTKRKKEVAAQKKAEHELKKAQ
ncbi:12806_t:CDS:2, partial [Cetraspora pellucida]